MPTQVQKRPSTTDGLQTSHMGVDKFPSSIPQDPMHHPSCDHRAKFNLQHREALRLALGSILAPKRPSMPGSRSSSGTASPAYSFSGSSGSYTPATPPSVPHTPSPDSHEHPYSRVHHPHPHYHPAHPPSKLGRVESHPNDSQTDGTASIPTSSTPPAQHVSLPQGPPHPLIRSRSQNPSNPPSSRTSPRLQPTTPPVMPPAIIVTDTEDVGASLPPPAHPVATTSNGDGAKIIAAQVAQDTSTSDDVPLPVAAGTQAATAATAGTGTPNQNQSGSGQSGAGTPRAKFIQTLQGKSAWDALIHGSFS